MKLHKTEDYHEDFGNCLFFHFETFEEPPELYCGSTNEVNFNEEYWNYFVKDFDFNSIFEQAEQFVFSDYDYDLGN